jgi:hypothetical protein
MRQIVLVTVVVLLAASSSLANSITLEAGWSVPRGDFADPPPSAVPKGAESSACFGFKYVRSLVVLDFVTELSYAEFAETYTGPAAAGERMDYTHTFIPATVGLRKSFFGPMPVRPYLGAAIGLYGYMARGDLLIEEPPGSGDFASKDFTAVIRPGLNFSAGVLLDVPFSFDLAAEVKYHVMVFQGVGDDLTDREFPYAIDADSRTFATLTFGVVF